MPIRKFTSILSVALLAAVSAVSTEQRSEAGFMVTSNPNGTTELSARIRWGNTGFEAAVYDAGVQKGTLNPGGTPVWSVGQGYGFEVKWDDSVGKLTLSVDFDRNNSFGSGESVSYIAASKIGNGFQHLSISGNEGGSAGRSNVSNLSINGHSQATLTPNGTFTETFYKDSTTFSVGQILVKGTLSFTTSGTAQERPSWNFNLINSSLATSPVPEPITLAAFGLGGLSLLAVRRRLNRR